VDVGTGARAATIAFTGRIGDQRPAVVFLHGWDVPAGAYSRWIDHLVRHGNTVIAPRYQVTRYDRPDGVRAAAEAGIRSALARLEVTPGSLVVAGHSAGAALAADVAAAAEAAGLPAPAGIFAVYPGRAIRGFPGGIPGAPLRNLPASAWLTVLVGKGDTVVGTAPGRAMVAEASGLSASRRRLVQVADRRVSDHFGPTRSTRPARRQFWDRLDRLLAAARGTSR